MELKEKFWSFGSQFSALKADLFSAFTLDNVYVLRVDVTNFWLHSTETVCSYGQTGQIEEGPVSLFKKNLQVCSRCLSEIEQKHALLQGLNLYVNLHIPNLLSRYALAPGEDNPNSKFFFRELMKLCTYLASREGISTPGTPAEQNALNIFNRELLSLMQDLLLLSGVKVPWKPSQKSVFMAGSLLDMAATGTPLAKEGSKLSDSTVFSELLRSNYIWHSGVWVVEVPVSALPYLSTRQMHVLDVKCLPDVEALLIAKAFMKDGIPVGPAVETAMALS